MDIKTRTRLGTVKILMLKGEKGDKGADGSSGDYSLLDNKPSINGTTLDGSKTSDELSLASASQVASVETDVSGLQSNVSGLGSRVSDIEGDLAVLLEQSPVYFGTCPTAASGTTDKIVTVASGFELKTGVAIAVKFDNDCIASMGYQRKLNVNGTGAKVVSVKGMTTMAYNPWKAGETVLFVYDGTYWQMLSTPTVNNLNNSFQIGNMLIQFGNVSTTANANAYTDTSATFPTAYSSAPAVFLTTLSTSTAAAFADVEICLAGVTTSGFTIRGFNNSASSRSPAVRWLAIGIV